MKKFATGFFVALLVALFIRLPGFGSVPNGLNRDEAAIGYNVYSILKTGKDEYGKFLPVSITSFGDKKLPGYVYTSIPFIALFDLTPVSVRLPSLLAGIGVILGTGLLAQFVSKSLKIEVGSSENFSTLAMLLAAISPWGNHFTRVAYEAHLAMAFFVSGLVCYFLAIANQKREKLIIGAAIFWSLALLTYHSYHIFLPLFVGLLLLIERKAIFSLSRTYIVTSLFIGTAAILLMYFGGVWRANTEKSIGISPFGAENILNQSLVFKQALPVESSFIKKLFSNRLTESVNTFSSNLVQVISAKTFFFNDVKDEKNNSSHNPGGIPNLHLISAPFILLGFVTLWEKRKVLISKRLLAWALAAIAVPAFTIHPNHTIRISPIFPLLEIVGAIGIFRAYKEITSTLGRKILVTTLVLIYVYSTARLFVQYHFIAPSTTVPDEKYHVLARAIHKYQDTYQVITQSPTSSPYIWYLFEEKYDPTLLQQNIERYPDDKEFFKHVRRIGNIYFENIDWDNVFERAAKQPIMLMLQPQEMSLDKNNDARVQYIDTLKGKDGQTFYNVWKVQ